MTKGSFSATGVDSIVLAKDVYRAGVTFQLISGGPVWIAFDEAAVDGEGIAISEAANLAEITDERARCAIHMKCAAGSTATGGYQTL
ncbi:MAG: hypothetical protein WCP34_06435 [Pseudomonadota bacterium]